MKKHPTTTEVSEAEPTGPAAASRSRRELLRTAALVGALGPMIVTLAPSEARAQGSWAASSLRDPYAGRPDMFEPQARFGRGGWVLPYSYEWRRREEARLRAEEVRRHRGY